MEEEIDGVGQSCPWCLYCICSACLKPLLAFFVKKQGLCSVASSSSKSEQHLCPTPWVLIVCESESQPSEHYEGEPAHCNDSAYTPEVVMCKLVSLLLTIFSLSQAREQMYHTVLEETGDRNAAQTLSLLTLVNLHFTEYMHNVATN